MYLEPDIQRQKQLKGLSEKSIGLSIMWCPNCDFQYEAGVGGKPTCPECGSGLHLTYITKELLDLNKKQENNVR